MKTIIIGTGAAGFNAADWLFDLGERDITILTEGINMGTSRNTGSDKQTYYKLALAGKDSDSIVQMAETLFDGGCVNGDTALVEAACSVKSFMKLVNLGVPFPTNIYGEYVGYKTDHDPKQRATSCGPLTSKVMTQVLESSVNSKNIEIVDYMQAIKLLVSNNQIYGLVAISTLDNNYHTFYCDNIILATGGPAGAYYNSVYPLSQTGATGLAIEANAAMCNMQEWQYGLASTKFRWNVSGTYQQVLPKYISVGKDNIPHEFLLDYYKNENDALDMVFLKGYQWPFDVRKIDTSSRIDMLVHEEISKGNRVFMDFTSNPTGLDYEKLSAETYTYLEKSAALFGTPIERLAKMNSKAIELYRDNGIDLYTEPLEVAVCAQHCNGGVAVDINWESSVKGLYVVGEAAGTFGVYRPGGSALNSTQVGSLRAAEHIAHKAHTTLKQDRPKENCHCIKYSDYSNLVEISTKNQQLMSQYAAFMRDIKSMNKLLLELQSQKENFFGIVKIKNDYELSHLYKSYDILITQIAMLSAMIFSAENCGTRGSALVENSHATSQHLDKIVTTKGDTSYFENVRQIPQNDDWFETVWNEYNLRTQKERT